MNEKKVPSEVVFSAPAATHSASTTPSTSSSSPGNSNGAAPTSTKVVVSSASAAQTVPRGPATPVVPDPNDEEAISYVNQEGDWKYRKINLFRVVRGFVSQLKPGQDLTKVSLPAECCTPYGLLEVMGSRELAMFHLTFGMNRYPDDPMERFWSALRFFFGTVRSERFDKKPWNPVLGETHITYADVIYGNDGVGLTETVPGTGAASSSKAAPVSAATASSSASNARSRTVFVGEQVSHHPPISAICLTNDREQIQCQANVSFTVKFGGNQVTVATAGELHLESKRFNETYQLTKCLPDMVVRNVVWGKKYIMWEGEVTMTCPQTGITAYLKFKEKSSQNVVKGYIMRGDSDEPLYEINGVCGERITYHAASDSKKSEKLLLDLTAEPAARIRYLPKSKLAPLSSVGVWEAVNKAVVDDDMTLADKEKKVIEQAQRTRRQARAEANQDFQGYYFDMSAEGMWTYKNNMSLETVLTEGAHSIDVPEESSDSSDEEYASQEDQEQMEPSNLDSAPAASGLSDFDRSPITSGDEFEDGDIDNDGVPRSPIMASSSHLDVSSPKRRRGSTSGSKHKPSLSTSSAQLTSSGSKKELRAEKKKAREEVKLVVTKMKEEKKKGTVSAQLLEGQVYAGWCKVRNMMKQWKDRYLVVLPGRLAIFRSPKEAGSSNASGLIQLQGCDVRPRPSKKDGACFKIFSLNQYPIYSRQGLKGETISSALLPVGSDYLILRCADPTHMNLWIEKIRQCIPDWEKSKTLIKAAGVEMDDSDSDEDSIDDSEPELAPPSSPTSSSAPSTALSATGTGNATDRGSSEPAERSAVITSEDILGQIGQLYKITRKVAQRQRKQMETLEEVKAKQGEAIEASKKAPAAAAAPAARRNPFEKKHSDVHAAANAEADAPAGLVGKIKAQLDVKTIALLLVIFYLLYLVLMAPSAPAIPAAASAATGAAAGAAKAATGKH